MEPTFNLRYCNEDKVLNASHGGFVMDVPVNTIVLRVNKDRKLSVKRPSPIGL